MGRLDEEDIRAAHAEVNGGEHARGHKYDPGSLNEVMQSAHKTTRSHETGSRVTPALLQTQPCTATGITLSVPSAALHAPGAVTLRVSIGQTGPTGVSAGSNQTIHFGFHPSVQH